MEGVDYHGHGKMAGWWTEYGIDYKRNWLQDEALDFDGWRSYDGNSMSWRGGRTWEEVE